MSYCYSLIRRLCYSSLCDYWCCCNCFPERLLIPKTLQSHDREHDDDWGITRDQEGKAQVARDSDMYKKSSVSVREAMLPSIVSSNSLLAEDTDKLVRSDSKEEGLESSPITMSKEMDGWSSYRTNSAINVVNNDNGTTDDDTSLSIAAAPTTTNDNFESS